MIFIYIYIYTYHLYELFHPNKSETKLEACYLSISLFVCNGEKKQTFSYHPRFVVAKAKNAENGTGFDPSWMQPKPVFSQGILTRRQGLPV